MVQETNAKNIDEVGAYIVSLYQTRRQEKIGSLKMTKKNK
jgi:hypothetical protein